MGVGAGAGTGGRGGSSGRFERWFAAGSSLTLRKICVREEQQAAEKAHMRQVTMDVCGAM